MTDLHFNTEATITMQQLIEKLITIVNFTKRGTDARKYSMNAIRFLVGDEMYEEAMKHIKA